MKVAIFDGKLRFDDIEDSLDTYYGIIDCRCIDIQVREVAGKVFDIVIDDEGRLVDHPKLSALSVYGDPDLVGTLVFCHHNDEGELTGLEEGDEEILKNGIISIPTISGEMKDVFLTDYVRY